MRDKVKEGIVETDRTLARIDGFQEGIKTANQQLANSFRIFAGKEQKEYPKEEFFQSNTSVMRKPWEWQKKVYQNLELHLDAAIDKVTNLSMDVQLHQMEKRWDEVFSKAHGEKEVAEAEVAVGVAEKEFKYGADDYDEYKENVVQIAQKESKKVTDRTVKQEQTVEKSR